MSVVLAARHADGSRSVIERALPAVRSDRLALHVTATGADGERFEATGERLVLDLGADARIDARFEDSWRWPRRSLGGLGFGHVVPLLSRYWHPHLLGATVTGDARFGQRELTLSGSSAYGEKNWGRGGTPRAWWWGQASCAEVVALAFAGGRARRRAGARARDRHRRACR